MEAAAVQQVLRMQQRQHGRWMTMMSFSMKAVSAVVAGLLLLRHTRAPALRVWQAPPHAAVRALARARALVTQ